MPVNPSQAGPYEIGISKELPSGATRQLLLSEVSIRGKRGYLKKLYGNRGGLDYVYVTNSSQYDARVSVSGGDGFQLVPAATSVNVDGPVSSVTVANESGSTIPAGKLSVSVGNGARNPSEGGGFSSGQLLSDLVPGYSNG